MNEKEKGMKKFPVVSVPDAKGFTGVVTVLGVGTGCVTVPIVTGDVTMGGGASGAVRVA